MERRVSARITGSAARFEEMIQFTLFIRQPNTKLVHWGRTPTSKWSGLDRFNPSGRFDYCRIRNKKKSQVANTPASGGSLGLLIDEERS